MSEENYKTTTQGQNASLSTIKRDTADNKDSDTFSEAELKSAVGFTRWQQLSADEVEAALAIRRAEIDSADITTIVGKGSDSALANRVALRSPVRYALLRQRAVREELF